MSARKSIAVAFIACPLAVNESTALQMLGLNDGRSLRAQKEAFQRLRALHEIRTLPGGVFPVRAIERAVEEKI